MTQPDTNVRRVFQTYVYATCFVTVVIALVSAALAIVSLIKIILPSLYGGGPGSESFVRKSATGTLISALVFGGVAFAVFAYHWALAKGVREELDRIHREPPPSIAAPVPQMHDTPTEELVENPAAVRPRPRQTRKPPASR